MWEPDTQESDIRESHTGAEQAVGIAAADTGTADIEAAGTAVRIPAADKVVPVPAGEQEPVPEQERVQVEQAGVQARVPERAQARAEPAVEGY